MDRAVERRPAGSVASSDVGDVRPEVDADQVEQAEDAGLREAERLAGDGVGLLDRQAEVDRLADRRSRSRRCRCGWR